MNSKFLSYYSKELRFLKEMGDEFAKQYPKVAARLALNTHDIPDPYIERLLEGVAFLTARTQLKLDAEYPRFVARILEVVYPDFLTPKPAAGIVNFTPLTHHQTDVLHRIERGQKLRSLPIDEYQVSCPFSVCETVTISPMQLDKAHYTENLSYLPNLNRLLPHTSKIQAALRLDFSLRVPHLVSDKLPEKLRLYLGSELAQSSSLLYLLMSACESVVCHASDNPKAWHTVLPQLPEQLGFADDEALTFNLNKSVSAFRLLQEYALLPEKFLFVAQVGIKQAIQAAERAGHLPTEPQQTEEVISEKGVNKKIVTYAKRTFSLSFLFNQSLPELSDWVQADNFSLNAAPVVNLFRQKGGRFPVHIQEREHHVLIDRTQPLNYEVHSIENITGFDVHNRQMHHFAPLYQSPDMGLFPDNKRQTGYFSTRREDRVPSDDVKRNGFRSSYLGSEVFVSLAGENAFNADIQHLAVDAWCSSRDLPLFMPRDSASDFLLEGALPLQSIRFVSKLTRPQAAPSEDECLWACLNQLSLNYLSLNDTQSAAEQLRGLLSVFVGEDDDFLNKQIEAIIRVHIEPTRQIVRHQGGAASVRGTAITIVLDEAQLGGVHPYLFGSLLNPYLSRLVSINSFVQLTIETAQQGKIVRFPIHIGARKIL